MSATTSIEAPAHDLTTTASSRATEAACRALDVVVAAVCLIVLAPLLLAIAIAVRLDSPGTVIFRQRRVGRGLDEFMVNKFRTMRTDAGHETHRAYVLKLIAGDAECFEDGEKAVFKMAHDDRITRLGRFLRRTSLDELPQLFNVLLGHMSLVGPRPSISYEVERYAAEWFERFAVKPGITGLWQVNGRSLLTFEEMIALDIEYARQRSFWLNVRILARTVPAVLLRRGAA